MWWGTIGHVLQYVWRASIYWHLPLQINLSLQSLNRNIFSLHPWSCGHVFHSINTQNCTNFLPWCTWRISHIHLEAERSIVELLSTVVKSRLPSCDCCTISWPTHTIDGMIQVTANKTRPLNSVGSQQQHLSRIVEVLFNTVMYGV